MTELAERVGLSRHNLGKEIIPNSNMEILKLNKIKVDVFNTVIYISVSVLQ